jgi:hypothetical protein
MKIRSDLMSRVFGLLKVIGFGEMRGYRHYWLCQCDCGNIKLILHSNLQGGQAQSCGCLVRKTTIDRNLKHGYSTRSNRAAEYSIWNMMIQRCENRNTKGYKNYGGRNIAVHPPWHKFENFIADNGLRPSPEYSLDRINNDGNYEPGNVRWATRKEQQRNTSRNKMISFNGLTMPMSAWAEKIGLSTGTLWYRFKSGWDVKKSLTVGV